LVFKSFFEKRTFSVLPEDSGLFVRALPKFDDVRDKSLSVSDGPRISCKCTKEKAMKRSVVQCTAYLVLTPGGRWSF
jgi:hypothetical protein